MLLERVRAEGFSGLPELDVRLERFSRVGGDARERRVLADAVHLGFGLLDRALMEQLLQQWGCEEVAVDMQDGLVGSARWDRAPGLAARVAPHFAGRGGPGERTLRVTLEIQADPPMFGQLRELARKDVRLLEALSGGARLTISVAARFTSDFNAVSVDLVSFLVGEEKIPIAGTERPEWLGRFLRGIGRRMQRGPAIHRWTAAAAAWDAAAQHALSRGLEMLRRPPFSLGNLRVMPEGLAQLNAAELVPIWQLGEEAELAAGLVGAVMLGQGDVLLWEGDLPPAWRPWLARQSEEAGSPLEQIVLLSARGEIPIREESPANQPPIKKPLRLMDRVRRAG